VGFSGSYYTNSTYGTMTYVYGPSVGFYLTALALSLQIAAYVIRSFAASDPATVVETRPDANIDSGPGLPPEIAVFSETDISAPPLSEPKDRT
jgi:hypothetical protein